MVQLESKLKALIKNLLSLNPVVAKVYVAKWKRAHTCMLLCSKHVLSYPNTSLVCVITPRAQQGVTVDFASLQISVGPVVRSIWFVR